MPSLILHIGTEKTGTTSTQQFLYRNRTPLEAAGYAVLDGFGVPNNEEIVWYSLGRTNHETYLRQKRAAIPAQIRRRRRLFRKNLAEAVAQAPADTVIITSEHFHSWMRTKSEVAELRDLLASCFDDIRVIAYFREQYDMARSRYFTRLVHHSTQDLREHLASCRPDDPYYDHLSTADRWSEVLGADRFHPRVFDRAGFPGGDVRRDFLAAIGIDGEHHDFDWSFPAWNLSLGPLGLGVMRSLNELLAPDAALNLEARRILMASPEAHQGRLDDPDEARRIRAEFVPSNAEFGRRHFGLDGSPFEPFPDLAETDASEVTPEQARDLAVRIVRFVRRTSG